MNKTTALQILMTVISTLFGCIIVAFSYRSIYAVWGIFATRKFAPAKTNHKYAVLVAARNESAVIGNLIESIRLQDYPKELVDIFVVADNCDDNTADIARQLGAVCYERNDMTKRTKGYALQFLVENIRKDYGIDAYEGYFLFDADNLLKKDFISRMNDAFDAGEKIVTSFRNTKNFGDNWISASYALHWMRVARTEHRARSSLRLATRIQGTGFLFAWEIIKDGWNYVSLTEDRAFCADAVVNGYKISYNDKAEFYDEQPTDMKTAFRQRVRWSKGHLQSFAESGGKLLWHIFITKGRANKDLPKTKENRSKRLLNNLRLRFMSFDMISVVVPFSLFTIIHSLSLFIIKNLLVIITLGHIIKQFVPAVVSTVFKAIGFELTVSGTLEALALVSLFSVISAFVSYIVSSLMAVYVFIFERKRIPPIKWYKKLWFCFTFPLFDIIDQISCSIALCKKVEWKPTPHNSSVSISQFDTEKETVTIK